MSARSSAKKPRRRNGIAAALKFFAPKAVKAKKGRKAYKRKPKHPGQEP